MSPCDRVPSGRPPLACTASGCHRKGPTPGACRPPSPTPQHPATHVSLCLSKVQTGTEWGHARCRHSKTNSCCRGPPRTPAPARPLPRVRARGCSLALPKCQLAFLIINFSLNVISNCSCSTEDTTQASAESARFGVGGRHPGHAEPCVLGEAAGLAPHGSGRQTAVTRDKASRAFNTNHREARHGAGVSGPTLRLWGRGSDPTSAAARPSPQPQNGEETAPASEDRPEDETGQSAQGAPRRAWGCLLIALPRPG